MPLVVLSVHADATGRSSGVVDDSRIGADAAVRLNDLPDRYLERVPADSIAVRYKFYGRRYRLGSGGVVSSLLQCGRRYLRSAAG